MKIDLAITSVAILSLIGLLACDPDPLIIDECPEPEVIVEECPPPPPEPEPDWQVCHQVDTGETNVFHAVIDECPEGWAHVCWWPQ